MAGRYASAFPKRPDFAHFAWCAVELWQVDEHSVIIHVAHQANCRHGAPAYDPATATSDLDVDQLISPVVIASAVVSAVSLAVDRQE